MTYASATINRFPRGSGNRPINGSDRQSPFAASVQTSRRGIRPRNPVWQHTLAPEIPVPTEFLSR